MKKAYCHPCPVSSLLQIRPNRPTLPSSEAIAIAAKYFGMTVAQMMERCKETNRVTARKMTYAYLKSRYGLKEQRISRLFKKCQTTINHAVREYKNDMDTEPKYCRQWSKFMLHMDAEVSERSKLYRVDCLKNAG